MLNVADANPVFVARKRNHVCLEDITVQETEIAAVFGLEAGSQDVDFLNGLHRRFKKSFFKKAG